MPRSEVHQKKRGKNWVLFALLMALITTIFVVAMIRMSEGSAL